MIAALYVDPTWLFAVDALLPSLRWSWGARVPGAARVGWCSNNSKAYEVGPRVSKKKAASTPPEFRDVLLDLARSVELLRAVREGRSHE